ncbi:MAG: hypothetical protein JWM28_3633 [Chitinophagaceae bacterium]|nr:hypothetical protein [Chitinophagaceae bacterium]
MALKSQVPKPHQRTVRKTAYPDFFRIGVKIIFQFVVCYQGSSDIALKSQYRSNPICPVFQRNTLWVEK